MKPNLSTGGRVRLLKAALSNDLVEQALADPTLADAMDLCIACKGCKRECGVTPVLTEAADEPIPA